MKLTELMELVKIGAGAFRLDASVFDLTLEQFKLIVERLALPKIKDYRPYVKINSIKVNKSPYVYSTATPLVAPDWISSARLLNFYAISSILSTLKVGSITGSTKPKVLWTYSKPEFYTNFVGEYEIEEVYFPYLEAITPSTPQDYEIRNYDEEGNVEHFIQLCQGYVMIAMGRERGSVGMTGMGVTLNGDDLVKDGMKLVDDTIKELHKESKFWLSVGV